MATLTAPSQTSVGDLPPARHRNVFERAWQWLRDHIIPICAVFALLFMFAPVFVVVAFSFNNPTGRTNYDWAGFSLDAWTDPCKDPGMCTAVQKSLEIGVIATIIATLLGTLMAFAMGRHRFRGRATTNLLIFLPMATPEIVLGASLLTLFFNAGFGGKLGFWTIAIAHIMFCISFVVVTVKARVVGLDPRLEQAAMDLYANERTTFWKVTFPLVLPGIVAAALLAFSLSFDDYVITNLNSGTTQTFPLWVWGISLRGIPPEANVVGAAMFFIALIVVAAPEIAKRRKKA